MTAGTDRSADHDVRVISIYATPWRYRALTAPDPSGQSSAAASVARTVLGREDGSRQLPGHGPARPQLEEWLPLGARLEEFHYLFQEQLPRLLYHGQPEVSSVGLLGADAVGDLRISGVRVWLFYLPSDQVVDAMDLEFLSPPLDVDPALTIRVLECCAFAELTIDGQGLGDYIAQLAEGCGAQMIREDVQLPPEDRRLRLPPERHQIVFAPPIEGQLLTDEQVQPILYRAEPPFRPEFIEIRRPLGLNPDDRTRGLVTPYTSLLVGHNEYIDNSVFLTAVQAVGTSARFRQIWHRAHGQVRDFRYKMQEEDVGVQTRAGMERLADELGNLELELSFSVETSSDLGLLIPTLRSVSFHRELYAAMELQERADRVSRMFARLDSSIRSELTAIDIRDARKDDRRRLRWNFALNLLSAVVVPIGVLLAFFGISTKDVDHERSILDIRHYEPVYLAAGALALIPLMAWAAAALLSAWRDRREHARQESVG